MSQHRSVFKTSSEFFTSSVISPEFFPIFFSSSRMPLQFVLNFFSSLGNPLNLQQLTLGLHLFKFLSSTPSLTHFSLYTPLFHSKCTCWLEAAWLISTFDTKTCQFSFSYHNIKIIKPVMLTGIATELREKILRDFQCINSRSGKQISYGSRTGGFKKSLFRF